MFCWSRISIHPCTKKPTWRTIYPQFISSVNLYMFRASGSVLYIYNNWYVLCFSVDCLLVGRLGNRKSIKKHSTYQLLYIYSIPPDDGLQICPKHVEFDWRNKLRINSVSSRFLLHGLTLNVYAEAALE